MSVLYLSRRGTFSIGGALAACSLLPVLWTPARAESRWESLPEFAPMARRVSRPVRARARVLVPQLAPSNRCACGDHGIRKDRCCSIARLQTFLDIPANEIGLIYGGKKKPTGIIDIALMQSLVRGGVVVVIEGAALKKLTFNLDIMTIPPMHLRRASSLCTAPQASAPD